MSDDEVVIMTEKDYIIQNLKREIEHLKAEIQQLRKEQNEQQSVESLQNK